MTRRATGRTATACVLLLTIALPGHAWAQAKRADPSVAAQQAFTRLDYPGAYRLAIEALRANPGNVEARRIAARSAKELQRPAECLRLLQPLRAETASTDDVGLVGECASASQFSPWSLSFLLQGSNNPSTKDIANFWLGRFYYRKGDYARAEGFLSQVALLPARLEKERVFMLERSREVLKAQAAPPPPDPDSEPEPPESSPPPATGSRPAKAPAGGGAPKSGTTGNAGAATSSGQVNKKEIQLPGASGAPARWSAASRSSLRKVAAQGSFLEPWAYGASGVGIRRGEEVPLGPDDQKPYDALVRERIAAEAARRPLPSTDPYSRVERKTVASNELHLDLVGGAQWGWNTALSGSGSQTRFGLDVRGGATAASYELPVYALADESLPPQFSIRIPHQGWAVGFGPFIEWAPNRNFAMLGEGTFQMSGPGYDRTLGRIEGKGAAILEFDPFEVRAGGRGGYLLGEDNQRGAQYGEASADLRVTRLGWFGLGAPEDYPMVRYHTMSPVSGSKSVVLFTALEGEFIEFNFAPRIFFGDQWGLMTWYRYVIGSKQSYVSPSKAALVEADPARRGQTFRPSADFTSASTDWLTELEWRPLRGLGVASGALVRKSITQYSEETFSSNPAEAALAYNYVSLLDSGGESWVRYFLEVRASF